MPEAARGAGRIAGGHPVDGPPGVPAPHQVAQDFWSSLVDWPLDSPRNLLFHVAVTAESTLWALSWAPHWGWCCRFASCIPAHWTAHFAVDCGVANRARAGHCAHCAGHFGQPGFCRVAPKAVIAMYPGASFRSRWPWCRACARRSGSRPRPHAHLMTASALAGLAGALVGPAGCLALLCSPRLRVGIAAPAWWGPWWPKDAGRAAGLGARLLTGCLLCNMIEYPVGAGDVGPAGPDADHGGGRR